MLTIVPFTTDNLKRIDISAVDDSLAVTVELKSFGADFWVSGLTQENGLVVISRLSIPLPGAQTETQLVSQAKDAYDKWVAPMAVEAKKFGGLIVVPQSPEAPTKRALCQAHLDLHKYLGHIESQSLDPKVDIARQYQLIKSIGFKSAVPMISERLGLKTTTVVRRIDTAKAQGLIPKSERPENLRDK
jgi:hypothetical protein